MQKIKFEDVCKLISIVFIFIGGQIMIFNDKWWIGLAVLLQAALLLINKSIENK